MKKSLIILATALLFAGCGDKAKETKNNDPAVTISQEEKERRIAIDFSRDSLWIVDYLKPYYPDLTQEQVQAWEASKALEGRIIDGEKRYFRNAGRNLFRIDKEAKHLYDSLNSPQRDVEDIYLDEYLREVIAAVRESGTNLVKPVRFTVRYKLTVKPDMVPDGKIVRAWMPYPRTDQNSVKDVELLASSDEYLIASDDFVHKSIYMEKPAVAGEATVFTYDVAFTVYNEWYDFKPEDIQPYDVNGDLYRKYTAEKAPHVVFSDRIRHLADSLAGAIDNPYLKARAIYAWICDNYPWASAREYSTIDNIPEYVLDNKHGDCGQVGLLFIAMARCAGVPARWQSGWMLHPGAVNMHDWGEVYYEGVGWVPVDQSFGRGRSEVRDVEDEYYYFTKGLDAYRWIVNSDYSGMMSPAKKFTRSETVDFQRGEVEWEEGNLYFNQWSGWIEDVQYEYL